MKETEEHKCKTFIFEEMLLYKFLYLDNKLTVCESESAKALEVNYTFKWNSEALLSRFI